MANVHVACCFDPKMSDLLPVLATSIARHADPASRVTLHAIHAGFQAAELARVMQLQVPPIEIVWHAMSDRLTVSSAAQPVQPTWWRLDLCQLLPDIERVIYVDMDMLVLCDLAPLMTMDLGQNVVAGAPDWFAIARRVPTNTIGHEQSRMLLSDYFKTIHGFDDATREGYTNAGFLVMDLAQLRATGLGQKLLESAKKNSGRLPYLDQSVINQVLAGRIARLGLEYNMFDNKRRCASRVRPHLQAEFRRAAAAPRILHFAGTKPWQRPWRQRGLEFWAYAELAHALEPFARQAYDNADRRAPPGLRHFYRALTRMAIARGIAIAARFRSRAA